MTTDRPGEPGPTPTPPGVSPLYLLTIVEAAAVLRVPEGWLRKKVSAGLVPHARLGKHVRFSVEHLHQIVANGTVTTTATGPTPHHGISARARRRALPT